MKILNALSQPHTSKKMYILHVRLSKYEPEYNDLQTINIKVRHMSQYQNKISLAMISTWVKHICPSKAAIFQLKFLDSPKT